MAGSGGVHGRLGQAECDHDSFTAPDTGPLGAVDAVAVVVEAVGLLEG
jgi:hypothetical protein